MPCWSGAPSSGSYLTAEKRTESQPFMKVITIMRALLLILVSLLALPVQADPALTAQSLLEKHAQALGPFEKIQTRRVHMRIIGMAPFEIPVVVEAKRPNLIRKDVTLQGNVQVTAFDGT